MEFEVRVYKGSKILELWQNDQLSETFNIGVGKVEVGHKKTRGDFKTPEGSYYICVKNPKSKFHLSLGINYPNMQDFKLALKENRIDEATFQRAQSAYEEKKLSLWDTLLGGEIYIHGDLESQEWTEGCVRMFREDIEKLYELLPIGTSVLIFP